MQYQSIILLYIVHIYRLVKLIDRSIIQSGIHTFDITFMLFLFRQLFQILQLFLLLFL